MISLSILYLLKYNILVIFTVITFALLAIDGAFHLIVRTQTQSFSARTRKWLTRSNGCIAAPVYLLICWAFFMHTWHRNIYEYGIVYYISGTIFSIYFSKALFVGLSTVSMLLKQFLSQRILLFKVLDKTILFVFICCMLLLLMGNFIWNTTFEIRPVAIHNAQIPKAFKNLKIVLFSDLHLGSFVYKQEFIKSIVAAINQQNPDMVFFTGDIVNSFAEEIDPFTDILKNIKSRYGNFAILGNHDYGDYFKWNTADEMSENHNHLIQSFAKFGFTLLQNEHEKITRDADTMYVCGVENWGHKPYRQEADLPKAMAHVPKGAFVVLLSHDPNFWNDYVRYMPNINITFSGHTHGMQIGFKIGKHEWSPFEVFFHYSKGLYKYNNQWLYVNKGIGGSLYPGRIGMTPEITVFTIQ